MKPEPKMNIQDESKNKKGKEINVDDGTVHMTDTAEPEEEEPEVKETGDAKAEPSLFFAITAIASLILIAFVIYGLAGQYFNMWEGKSIPVIGYEQAASNGK